ncbi:hypothetical protein [Reichenbachiella sp.]
MNINILIQCLTFTLLSTSQVANCQNQLENFLKLNGYKVEEETIHRDINYFLDTRFKANKLQWHIGSVRLPNGQVYDSLHLKMNTIKNALYVKIQSRTYRFSPTAISSFNINFHNENRYFETGFGALKSYQMEAKFRTSSKELIKYIMDSEEIDNINIEQLTIDSESRENSLRIKISSFGEEELFSFKKLLTDHSQIYNVHINSDLAEINERTFFEILYQSNDLYLLKLNSKKNLTSGSVSLVNQNEQIIINDQLYFLSNQHKNLVQVNFNKNAVKTALSQLGYDVNNELLSVRNEKRLIECIEQYHKNLSK